MHKHTNQISHFSQGVKLDDLEIRPGRATLASRLRFLIALHQSGSVNAAAKEIGIPQSTLARIADGRVENPRANALNQIAFYYRVSLDWLVSGRGEGPGMLREDVEILPWLNVTDSLDLPYLIDVYVRKLPFSIIAAFNALVLGGDIESSINWQYPPAVSELWSNEQRLWTAFLQSWISLAGRDKVRKSLIENALLVRARFSPQRPLCAEELNMLQSEQENARL